jgi:hypothetical protein
MKTFLRVIVACVALYLSCSTPTHLKTGQGCSKCSDTGPKTSEMVTPLFVPIGLQVANVIVAHEDAKIILQSIQHIYALSKPALTMLAKRCNNQQTSLTPEYIELLKDTGFINQDGSIDPTMKQLIKETVLLYTPETPDAKDAATQSILADDLSEIQQLISFDDYARWCETQHRVVYRQVR